MWISSQYILVKRLMGASYEYRAVVKFGQVPTHSRYKLTVTECSGRVGLQQLLNLLNCRVRKGNTVLCGHSATSLPYKWSRMAQDYGEAGISWWYPNMLTYPHVICMLRYCRDIVRPEFNLMRRRCSVCVSTSVGAPPSIVTLHAVSDSSYTVV